MDGPAVNIATVNKRNYQATFNNFTFGTKAGEWTWAGAAKQPAINLPF